MSATDLLQFPCDFPVKVLGEDSDDFRNGTRAIVERHAGPLADERISCRRSRTGRFLAVTFTIVAGSRAQLDAIYEELSAHPLVVMSL